MSGIDAQDGQGASIATDAAGNTYVTGGFTNTLTIGTVNLVSAGISDIFVAKFDPGGQLLWAVREGGIHEDRGYGISLDGNGNIYVSGTFSATVNFGLNTYTSAGLKDIVLLKYDNNGIVSWAKTWGAAQDDQGWGINVRNDRVYMTGSFRETVDFDGNTMTSGAIVNIFLLKADTSGNIIWSKKAGGNSMNYADFGKNIYIDSLGGLYITGFGSSSIKYFDNVWLANSSMFIVRYDTNGNALWAKGADGGISGSSVKTDASGNVYAVGYGSFPQDLNFGTVTLFNSTNYIAKYNSSGTLQWAKHVSEMPTSAIRDLVLDGQGNIYITGYMGTWGIFGNDTIYTNGGQDVWVAKLDNNGNHLWSALGGGAGADGAYAIALDNNGSIVTTGYIASSTASFGPYTVNGGGGQDMFVAKLSQTTGLPITNNDKQLYIYPNPANDMLYIKGLKESTEYRMMNVTGALVEQGILNRNSIDISRLPAGMYLLYVGGEVHKLMKE